MSIKTNKSFQKRLKITKRGKLIARKTGQNHFNSKEKNSEKRAKAKNTLFHMTNKEMSRFLVNLK